MQTQKIGLVYVARRRLGTGDSAIWPGELVDCSTWKPYIIDVYIRQELIHPVPVVTDADRQAVEAQWQQEEAAREARRAEALASVEPTPSAPPPEPPLRWVRCANCREPAAWDEPPDDTERFVCGFCGQPQTVMQARRNLLQLRGDPRSIPVYDHGPVVVNHARRSEDLTDPFKAMLEDRARAASLAPTGVPEERRANEDQAATPG